MDNRSKKCPKCGFKMTDNYCLKCGYTKNIFINNMDKYKENISDIELYFKDSYSSILHSENNKKIFLLGPIYLSYRNNFILGILFCILEFFSSFYLAKKFLAMFIALYIFIFNIIFLRFLYMFFFDLIVLEMGKLKIKKMSKKYKDNYYEKLENSRPNSLIKAILSIILWALIIYLFAYFY